MNHPAPLAPEALYQGLQRGDYLLIDVREPAEFAAAHIPAALSVPLSQLPGLWPALRPSKQRVVFQCQQGTRSYAACTALGADASGALTLQGGLAAWVAAGLPVVGQAGPQLPIMRQVQMIVGGAVAILVAVGFLFSQPWAFVGAGLLGGALFTAGLTGWCGLALLLQRLPWNR